MAASSSSPTRRGVARTWTPLLPSASAVSAGWTTISTSPTSPGVISMAPSSSRRTLRNRRGSRQAASAGREHEEDDAQPRDQACYGPFSLSPLDPLGERAGRGGDAPAP